MYVGKVTIPVRESETAIAAKIMLVEFRIFLRRKTEITTKLKRDVTITIISQMYRYSALSKS
jgi:hypothetical protein